MRRTRWSTLALLALTACTAAQQAARAREAIGEPAHDVITGTYTVVRCYFDNLDACRQAAEIADSAYIKSSGFLALKLEPPRHPLEIELVASNRDLSSVDRELGIQTEPGRKGFTTSASESIYLDCESCSPKRALPTGLIGWDRASVAHEVLHLTNSLRIDNADFELPWITEGEATEFEELFMRQRGAMRSVEECSIEAFRMAMAQRLLADGKLPPVREIISTPLDQIPGPPRYAIWWLFYRFMDTGLHQERFRQFMGWVRQAPIRDYHRVAEMFSDVFGFPAMDTEFAEYLHTLRPAWVGGTIDTLGDGWAQVAGRHGARAWRAPGHDRLAVEGEVSRAHGHGQVMMLYGSPKQTCFAVDLLDRDHIAIIQPPAEPRTPGTKRAPPWKSLASAPVTAPLESQPVPFRIDLMAGKVVLQEAGQTLIAAAPPCAAPGAWGFFSGTSTTSLWRNVEFVAPPSALPLASSADAGLPAETAPPIEEAPLTDGG